MNDHEPRGLVCFSTTAAQAYIGGLEAAIRLIEEYDRIWDTCDYGYCDHIRHQIQMFRSNWEIRNKIKLPGQEPHTPLCVPPEIDAARPKNIVLNGDRQ